MPWQRRAADVALELLPDGSWAYPIVVVTVQRQAGKTTMFGPIAHERAATVPDAKCWWTAQTRQDARDSWFDMLEAVKRSPLGQVAKIRESNGSESVTYPGGGTFRPFAPTEDALHGKANELVAVDEAWAFDAIEGAALDQAILPTFTTTGGQLWIISTAGTAASLWLLDYVRKGRAAVATGSRDICLIEYGVDEDTAAEVERAMSAYKEAAEAASVEHPIPAELTEAYHAALRAVLAVHPGNPEFGGRLKFSALLQAAAKMTPGDFLRAYGNHWTGASEQVIPAHAYANTRVPAPSWPAPDPSTVTLTVDVALDGADAAIGAAWQPEVAGPVFLDVVDARPGTAWVVDRVVELRARWGIAAPIAVDGSGPNLDVLDELRRRLGEDNVRALNTRETLTACSGILSAFLTLDVRHTDRPALDAAVASAARRQVGDGGWAFSRRLSPASIAALNAVTVARWALLHRPAAPERPAIVVRSDSSRRASAAARRAARGARKRD